LLLCSNRVRHDGSVFFRSQNVGCWDAHDLDKAAVSLTNIFPCIYRRLSHAWRVELIWLSTNYRYDIIEMWVAYFTAILPTDRFKLLNWDLSCWWRRMPGKKSFWIYQLFRQIYCLHLYDISNNRLPDQTVP
jgi:hypothetical protein